MPLIFCPSCQKITYAYPIFDEEGDLVAYRCSLCYNVYNVGQVEVIPFPNERIVLAATFAEVVAEHENRNVDDVYADYSGKEIAEKFLRVLEEHAGTRVAKWVYAPWDYRGTREANEYNEELEENAEHELAPLVDKGYTILEITEPDEGDSIYIAVSPRDHEKIKETLRKYVY